MPFNIDPIYVIYLLVAVSAGLFVEGVYLLCFSGASYRKNVNRRLRLLKDEPNRENLLVQLRKERGLTSAGNYRMGMESLNRLILQSGLTIGLSKLVTFVAVGAVAAAGVDLILRGNPLEALLIARVLRHCAAVPGAAHSAQSAAEGVRRPVSRRPRHDRAQPACRPSGPDRAHDGRP